MRSRPSPGVRAAAIAVVCGALLLSALWPVFPGLESTHAAQTLAIDEAVAAELIDEGRCHCGCGRSLPSSRKGLACFGCSVGKAEVSFILESLLAGRSGNAILLDLQQPILVEVFGDYDDLELPEIWRRAQRIAEEFRQHRVVLRSPAHSEHATAAMRLVECGRSQGHFAELQGLAIEHAGPWERADLLRLGAAAELDGKLLAECLERIDVRAQLRRDREHVRLRRISPLPGVTVNRVRIRAAESEIRSAIRKALLEGSI